MILPKKTSNKGKVISAIIAIVVVVIIIAGVAAAINHDNSVIQEALDYGCVAEAWSFTGKPTIWRCPPGTPEHIGSY